VKVHYTGKLDDGATFHSSIGREPLQLSIGAEQIIPAFEQAIIGMNPGDLRTIVVQAEEAFAPYHEELVRTIERTEFPAGLEPEVGQKLGRTTQWFCKHKVWVCLLSFTNTALSRMGRATTGEEQCDSIFPVRKLNTYGLTAHRYVWFAERRSGRKCQTMLT
jgi:hypothetical protein